jgi:hypothetical protein
MLFTAKSSARAHREVVAHKVPVALARVELDLQSSIIFPSASALHANGKAAQQESNRSAACKGSKSQQEINRREGLPTAKPRGSRSVSGEPRSWMTVEKRTMTGVCTPGARSTSAQVRCEMSCVTCGTSHGPSIPLSKSLSLWLWVQSLSELPSQQTLLPKYLRGLRAAPGPLLRHRAWDLR